MLKVSEAKYEISYRDEVIDLTPKEYDLLKIFIYQSHKVISKSETVSYTHLTLPTKRIV